MMQNSLKERIDQRLKDLNISARSASLKAGLHPDTIGKVLNGKTKNLRGDNLSAVAKVLKSSESWLTSGEADQGPAADSRPGGIKYGGVVEAGAFRKVDLLDQDGDYKLVRLAPIPGYPVRDQVAFKVEGDSMDLADIKPGMWVHAIDLHAFERISGTPSDGSLVVVAIDQDGQREMTVKRLRIFRDRYELQPDSSNPRHKPIVFRHGATDEPTGPRIIGVVLQASRIYHDPMRQWD